MLVLVSHRRLLAAAAIAAAVATPGCANIRGSEVNTGPAPAKTLPPVLARLANTDVGQYYVTPRPDLTKKQLDGAVSYLRNQGDVNLTIEQDGRLNVQFYGNPNHKRKAELLKELVAIGKVDQGI
jgi:hypothetical protein